VLRNGCRGRSLGRLTQLGPGDSGTFAGLEPSMPMPAPSLAGIASPVPALPAPAAGTVRLTAAQAMELRSVAGLHGHNSAARGGQLRRQTLLRLGLITWPGPEITNAGRAWLEANP